MFKTCFKRAVKSGMILIKMSEKVNEVMSNLIHTRF